MPLRNLIITALFLAILGGGVVLAQSLPRAVTVPDQTVTVGGTVSLSESTLSSLADPTCRVSGWSIQTVDTTPTSLPIELPDGGNPNLTTRTQIIACNLSQALDICCDVVGTDRPPPDCVEHGAKIPPGECLPWTQEPSGFDFQCRSSSATAQVNIKQGDCK